MVFAQHLIHDNEYEASPMTPAPPTNNKKYHIKDNLTPPFNPPAWEFDMAIDPPHEEASMEKFAHHLLHDEEYEMTSPRSSSGSFPRHHIKDNYEPPTTPTTPATTDKKDNTRELLVSSPRSYLLRHIKDNYEPPETPIARYNKDMEETLKEAHSTFGSLSYAGHFESASGHRHSL
jgi:hypothetical protein